jgi:hypothetical protein
MSCRPYVLGHDGHPNLAMPSIATGLAPEPDAGWATLCTIPQRQGRIGFFVSFFIL